MDDKRSQFSLRVVVPEDETQSLLDQAIDALGDVAEEYVESWLHVLWGYIVRFVQSMGCCKNVGVQ